MLCVLAVDLDSDIIVNIDVICMTLLGARPSQHAAYHNSLVISTLVQAVEMFSH